MTRDEVLAAWHRARGSIFTMVKDSEVIAFAEALGVRLGDFCTCSEGPYFGAQMAGTPLRCERCGREADVAAWPEPAAECEHDPRFSRSICGLCGEQESWCAKCSDTLCGCRRG